MTSSATVSKFPEVFVPFPEDQLEEATSGCCCCGCWHLLRQLYRWIRKKTSRRKNKGCKNVREQKTSEEGTPPGKSESEEIAVGQFLDLPCIDDSIVEEETVTQEHPVEERAAEDRETTPPGAARRDGILTIYFYLIERDNTTKTSKATPTTEEDQRAGTEGKTSRPAGDDSTADPFQDIPFIDEVDEGDESTENTAAENVENREEERSEEPQGETVDTLTLYFYLLERDTIRKDKNENTTPEEDEKRGKEPRKVEVAASGSVKEEKPRENGMFGNSPPLGPARVAWARRRAAEMERRRARTYRTSAPPTRTASPAVTK